MTTILGVAEVVLYVSDLDKAADFYTEISGPSLWSHLASLTAEHRRIDLEW